MRTLTTILLFAAMYFIMSGYYEEKIEKLNIVILAFIYYLGIYPGI